MISKEEVQHIAKLARLELTEKEAEKMQKDLSSILDYFDILKKAPKIKTGKRGLGSTQSGLDDSLIRTNKGIRKDEVVQKPASLANNLIAQAPDRKDGYVKVKSIL